MLSQNTNYYFQTDSLNQVWISSVEGFNVYNGIDTRIIKANNKNFTNNNIQSLFTQPNKSTIWSTTYFDLNKYDLRTNKFKFFQVNSNPSENEDYKIIGFNNADIYLRTNKKFYKFKKNTEAFIDSCKINLTDYQNESAIFKDNRIYLCFAHRKNTLILSIDQNNINNIDTLEFLQVGSNSVITWQNKFLISTLDNLLMIYDLEINRSYKIDSGVTEILDLHNFNDSLLYILSKSKILIKPFSDLKETISEISLTIKGNPTKLYVDQDQVIWYGIDGKGVFYFLEKKIKVNHLKLITNDLVANARSILQDKTGRYWICSRNNGITSFSINDTIVNNYILNQSNKLVFDLDQNRAGEIYANARHKLFKYNFQTDKFYPINIDLKVAPDFYDILINFRDELIVCGGQKDDFYKIEYNNSKNKYDSIPILDILPNNYIMSGIELKSHNLVLGINGRSISIYQAAESIYNFKKNINIASDLTSIWEQSASREIYLSSTSGLFHFPNGLEGDFTKLSDKKGLLDQTIYYILGHKEFLYLSSNQGLLRYNTIDSTVHQFTLADGIQGLEYNTTAGLKDRDGNFLFGGTNGINVFHPDSIKFLDYDTPIHLSNILVNDDEYDWEYNISLEDTIKFDYENNTLTFQFHGIDYSDPEAVELKCIMENYDKEWVNIDKNDGSVRYPNLPPGHYTFKMQATNSDKIWSNIIREIDVTITPPFWQTWWFRILSLLIISSITWLLIKSYYKRQLVKKDLELREQRLQFEKQEALQNERNRIASEMHDDLGGGLTSIKFLAHRALKSKEDKSPHEIIEKIIHHSATLINNMSEIIWAMNSGYDTLPNLIAYIRNYLKKQCEEFELDLEILIQKEIKEIEFSGQKRRNIFLVIKEAFHNTLKYAEADQIKFEVTIENNNLTLNYKDNGIGFDETEIVPGNGLKNMKKRVEEIDGQLTLKSDHGVELIMTFPI